MACWAGAFRPFLGSADGDARATLPACFRDGMTGLRRVLRQQGSRYEIQLDGSGTPTQDTFLGPKQWWPSVEEGLHGEPVFRFESCGATQACSPDESGAEQFDGDPASLLELALALADACKSNREGGQARAPGGDVWEVQLALERENATIWGVATPGSDTPTTCSQARLADVPVEVVLWSIYDPKERLCWDSSSFVHFDRLSPPSPQGAASLGDAILCRMPGPPSVSDRYVVQERFLLRLKSGGFAIVMASPPEPRTQSLLRPGEASDREPLLRPPEAATEGAVQATTHMSAYLLEPSEDGRFLTVTSMSRTDFGGSVPKWVQNMAKKAGQTHFLKWSEKLQVHCSARVAQARRPLRLSAGGRADELRREAPDEVGGQSVCQQLLASFTVQITIYQIIFLMLALYLGADYLLTRFQSNRSPGISGVDERGGGFSVPFRGL